MNVLRQAGYTLLRLPRADVKPLTLLLKTSKGAVEKLNADIRSLFEPVDLQPPAISKDIPLPSALSSEEKLDLKTELNFSFLKGLLTAFTGSADLSLTNADTILVQLGDAKIKSIDIIKLDAFIQNAKVNTMAKSILERLKDDDLFVITEVINAKSFTINESSNATVSAEASATVKAVEAGSSTNYSEERKRNIANKDDNYYTIAMKAYQIFYDKPSLFSSRPAGFRIREATNIKVFRGEEDYAGKPLKEAVVEISEAGASE